MISNVIVNILDSNITELNKGTNLFAEKGILSPCTFIKTDTYPLGSIVPEVRRTHARIFIKGYEYAEAIELGERMVVALKDVKGNFEYNTEKYNVKAIEILSLPTIISIEEKIIQFKIQVYYIKNS